MMTSSRIGFAGVSAVLRAGRSSARRCTLAAADAVILQRHFVILAQRMADPILGAQNPPQVRVADEIARRSGRRLRARASRPCSTRR